MGWQITYNDFGSDPGSGDSNWSNISIDNYRSEAILAPDNETHETTRQTLSGTALIHVGPGPTQNELFEELLVQARSQLSRQGKHLVITAGGDTMFANVYGQAEDESDQNDETLGTPRCDFSITRIMGELSAIVGFTFTWHDYEIITTTTETDNYHVMSHVWTQRFKLAESGLQTHIVDGWARVRADAGLAGMGVLLGANPDRYRALIIPALPAPGFRQISAEFFIDETAQRLVYHIENQEYARELPGPATQGDGRFTWRRSLDAGDSMLGYKVFEGELEGEVGSDRGALLSALILASKERINYVPTEGTNSDQIMSIEITEVDIFSKNRIGLKVEARGAGDGSSPWGNGPGFDLLVDLTAGADSYSRPGPYGAQMIAAVRRNLFQPASGYNELNFPKAQTESVALAAPDDYVAPISMVAALTDLPDAGVAFAQSQPENQEYPYTKISVTERMHRNPCMVVLHGAGLESNTIAYQTRKPDVYIVSNYTLVRQNKAPDLVQLSMPAGSILLASNYDVKPGRVDANNNREYVATYNRVLQVADTGLTGWTSQLAGGVTVRVFDPPSGVLAFGWDPSTEAPDEAADRVVFDTLTNFDFSIPPDVYAT